MTTYHVNDPANRGFPHEDFVLKFLAGALFENSKTPLLLTPLLLCFRLYKTKTSSCPCSALLFLFFIKAVALRHADMFLVAETAEIKSRSAF